MAVAVPEPSGPRRPPEPEAAAPEPVSVWDPYLLVSWAGMAACIQELTDLVFLGGVVTMALGRLRSRP